jgi:MGT family glycosyltransferase
MPSGGYMNLPALRRAPDFRLVYEHSPSYYSRTVWSSVETDPAGGAAMAKAWFFNIPTHGHINPTLPLVRELVQQGDEITYFAGPRFEEKIRATGAAYGDYGDVYAFDQSRTVAHSILQGSQLAEAAAAILPQVLDSIENERPDYLLFDMSAPWGNIAAQRYDLPAVACFPHLPFNWRTFLSDKRVLRKGAHSLRPGHGYYRRLQRETGKLAREQKLRKPSEINVLSSSAELNIVFSSRYFQPFEENFDDSYHYVGPVINTDRPDEPFAISRGPGQKLIYIAVGTLYQANKVFFEQCMEAFAGDDYAVIMSVGKAVDPEDLGPIPTNFTVAQFVPQLAILDEADLFVTHSGMNSINEAVLALVPMVGVPNTIEQAVNAFRVEQLHGGLYLEPEKLTAGKLRSAAEQVLADPEVRPGLQKIRQSFLQAGGVESAVEAIQAFKKTQGVA